MPSLDFATVNRAARGRMLDICTRWLPGGKVQGPEYIALNPRRIDRRLGSFRVNLDTGRWADFAIEGARGGDPISLAAFLFNLSQAEAARKLAGMLGVGDG